MSNVDLIEGNQMSGDDQVTLCINQMLNDFSNTTERPSIHRVSDRLRITNEKEYDPIVISIGPFHRDKDHLKNMEHHKLRYLKLLLESRQESCVDRYVIAIRNLEEKARKCYAESFELGKDEFVKMLLLDGIFIIEFLRKYHDVDKWEVLCKDDPIFEFEHAIVDIFRDLILFENQIPLFILAELFNLLEIHDQEKIVDLIRPLLLSSEIPELEGILWRDSHHLLGFVHYVTCSSFARRDRIDVEMVNINSARELTEAGIIFKKPKNQMTNLLDIRFKNSKIYIPTLVISDETESKFRNMIAYEYSFPCSEQKYISDYLFFLHCLIHSPEDAMLLRRYGIISNWLGGDEMVYQLIKQLGTNVITSEKFSYSDVFHNVNRHCEKRRNRWMAVLRRDYFNTPWKFISVVAAVVLLSVGVVQMVYAILAYEKAS